jgi:hypothetical protein
MKRKPKKQSTHPIDACMRCKHCNHYAVTRMNLARCRLEHDLRDEARSTVCCDDFTVS